MAETSGASAESPQRALLDRVGRPGESRRFELESAVPAQSGERELRWALGDEELQVVERDEQARVAHLLEGDLGREEVALPDRAGEPAGCRALGTRPRRSHGVGCLESYAAARS